jgi:demethylmenaquinone methyltransferase/2-methoxy-6-polyprenyl-1,4-benzoquinol methylase
MDNYARKLRLSDLLREPVMKAAVATLALPAGSRGLDLGCGIGSHTRLLCEAVGESGHVTGTDISPAFLDFAAKSADAQCLRDRVDWEQGDLAKLPFADAAFDWIWSVDCLGFIGDRPETMLAEPLRVLKPGGLLAFLCWSSQQLLPGHPVLEAKLNASTQGIAPFVAGADPQRHVLRAPAWLRERGLHDIQARSFVGDVQAPLSGERREAMLSLFAMRWGEEGTELPAELQSEYQRLCRPDSPDLILDEPDYYAFFTYSMFSGRTS